MKRIASLALAVAFAMAIVTPSAAVADDAEFADVAALASAAQQAKEAGDLHARYIKEVGAQVSKLGDQMIAAGYDSSTSKEVTSSLDAFMRAKDRCHPGHAKKWTDAVRLQLGLFIEPLPNLEDLCSGCSEGWEKGRKVYLLYHLPYYEQYLREVILPQITDEGDAQ